MNSPKTGSHHQGMYKSPSLNRKAISNIGNVEIDKDSPSWRNVYKKRCFDEFKKSRQKLVNRFRTLDVNYKFLKNRLSN
jgi:hypothetical protein